MPLRALRGFGRVTHGKAPTWRGTVLMPLRALRGFGRRARVGASGVCLCLNALAGIEGFRTDFNETVKNLLDMS